VLKVLVGIVLLLSPLSSFAGPYVICGGGSIGVYSTDEATTSLNSQIRAAEKKGQIVVSQPSAFSLVDRAQICVTVSEPKADSKSDNHN